VLCDGKEIRYPQVSFFDTPKAPFISVLDACSTSGYRKHYLRYWVFKN